MASANGATRAVPPRSSETAATVSLPAVFSCRSSDLGISLRQGWHHVAHRLTMTGFPLKSARLAGLPAVSVKAACGAGCGGVAGINSPGLSFSSAAAAAESTQRSTRRAVPNQADPPANPHADPPANPLWGGRFDGGPAAIMRRINASIDFDKRLYAEDIAG